MKIRVSWHARDFVALLGKLHAPGKCRRFAPATSGGKAALATEEITNGDSGRAGISRFPPGESIVLHQQIAREHRAEQSAVKDTAGTKKVQREKLKRMIAILRLGKEHQDLRADERSQQHPQAEIVDSLTRQTIARRELDRDQNRAEKCDGEKDAVRVDGEIADANNF